MAWASYDSQNIVEASAGAGAGTDEITLNPGEKAHVFVTRTGDFGAADAWRIAVEGSVEDTPDYAQNPPLREYRQTAAQTKKSFIVAGVYAFRVFIQNDDSDTDEVGATVGWRKDGVNI